MVGRRRDVAAVDERLVPRNVGRIVLGLDGRGCQPEDRVTLPLRENAPLLVGARHAMKGVRMRKEKRRCGLAG